MHKYLNKKKKNVFLIREQVIAAFDVLLESVLPICFRFVVALVHYTLQLLHRLLFSINRYW